MGLTSGNACRPLSVFHGPPNIRLFLIFVKAKGLMDVSTCVRRSFCYSWETGGALGISCRGGGLIDPVKNRNGGGGAPEKKKLNE